MSEDQLSLDLSKANEGRDESPDATGKATVAQKRDKLVAAVASNHLDNMERRVARLLNFFPETRDSDISLQLKYWELFESNLYTGGPISPDNYYKLSRLNSIARARAKIQNTYNLYQASPEIQKHRGKLSEEEYERKKGKPAPQAVTLVTVDESGKTGKVLVVGSFWCQDGLETFHLQQAISEWRRNNKFESELHFKDIDHSNLGNYCQFIDFLTDRLSLFSFKAITVPRSGLKQLDQALGDLIFHLLVRGIEHEHASGRAPLPRSLQVWKDLEEEGADKLLVANLSERVSTVSESRFDGALTVDQFDALVSHEVPLLQIADLYTGALGRIANATGDGNAPKDKVARYMVERLGLKSDPTDEDVVSDMAVRISL